MPMSSQISPQLSKSRFVAGLQCLKRLYLECYHRDLADQIDPSQQARFDSGTAVGELARQRFPHGKLINEQYFEHSQALKSTQDLLTDTSIPALYEAGFAFQGTLVTTNCGDVFTNSSREPNSSTPNSSFKLVFDSGVRDTMPVTWNRSGHALTIRKKKSVLHPVPMIPNRIINSSRLCNETAVSLGQ